MSEMTWADVDHNTVHKLKAMLVSESEDHRTEARRLLNLVTDNRSVVELMGAAPPCQASGCQLLSIRSAAARFGSTDTLFLARLSDEDYDRVLNSHVLFSGATGKGQRDGYGGLGPYIASFMGQLPAVIAALGKPVILASHRQGFVLRVFDLTFDDLRAANQQRCETAWHPIKFWSPMQWGCAVAGEVGEACNLAKKIERLESSPQWNKANDRDAELLADRLAEECADAVIYLDLLLQRVGRNLGDAVRLKFNVKSAEIGSEVML